MKDKKFFMALLPHILEGGILGIVVVIVVNFAHKICPYYGPAGLIGMALVVHIKIKAYRNRGRVVHPVIAIRKWWRFW